MPRKNTRRQTTSTMSSNSATSPTNVSLSDHKQSDESPQDSSSESVSIATTDILVQTNQKLNELISIFGQFLTHQLQLGRSTGTIPPVPSVTPPTGTILPVPSVTPQTGTVPLVIPRTISSPTGLSAGSPMSDSTVIVPSVHVNAGVPNMTVPTNELTGSSTNGRYNDSAHKPHYTTYKGFVGHHKEATKFDKTMRATNQRMVGYHSSSSVNHVNDDLEDNGVNAEAYQEAVRLYDHGFSPGTEQHHYVNPVLQKQSDVPIFILLYSCMNTQSWLF